MLLRGTQTTNSLPTIKIERTTSDHRVFLELTLPEELPDSLIEQIFKENKED